MTTPQSFVQTLDEKLSQAAAAQLRQAGTEAEVATPAFWGAPLFTPRPGAFDLDPGFSDRQLRRAFRTLAKQFHPDRHPASSATEKEGLACTFASVCSAYRELAESSGQREPAAQHS